MPAQNRRPDTWLRLSDLFIVHLRPPGRGRALASVAILTIATASCHAEEHGFWWYQEAKIACIGDVIRLCRSFVPDEDTVRACMETKKAQVSPGCAEFYPGGSKAN